ncbi:hypothetical protein N5P37_002772 [Trichoderma harzianum]|uniref:Major facilitator superfamily (MFS) profile domain-containing protein n=1 Tax=Trichoderma harzianum CBS 226.95 TaxID=983964 RepID=A0A2T4AS95_TRIHA|nr:hypothetical protein M431DRAFT_103038 [Trichoderma harzianum CBS 226.95]KAK0763395.1 hypothetical protein N5P37_002772 [Trichoderma harzianum]PKK45216.1 hypothetical protein CI102_9347 [Trichoderma harzianum]PTB59941.1 hypothetical protein M431DRAFT_103038 [Trichoderma harzianum CBS 226.95]
MNLATNEGSGIADQHHIHAVNSAAKNTKGQPHNSRITSDRGIAGDEKDGTFISPIDGTVHKSPVAVSKLADLSADASTAADSERKMSLLEGIRLYPKAIFFSFALSLAVVMEGYDTWLLSSFYGMAAFAKKYGQYTGLDKEGNPTYQLSATWQNALGNGTSAAQIIGLFINGIVAERIGYRWTMIGALFAITCFIFIQFFAVNVEMLLAGYIMSGLPWGVFQTLTTTYAAEVCPVPLRAYLTTYVNLCWVIGQLIASGVLKGFVSGDTEWSYRIPYAIQWVWPIPIAIATFFAPESPWWLVRHGKIEQAREALLRLTSQKTNPNFNVEETLSMMIHTHQMEIEQTSGTSYWDCFKGVDLRRTELAVMTWVIQHTSGSPMIGAGTYFMEQAGLSPSNAFSLGVGQSAMAFVGTVGSWFLMPHFGRRTLYLWGQILMFTILVTVGVLGIPKLNSGISWATGALILILTFAYDLTVGPVCYSLVAELPSNRLRIKTVALSRNSYLASGFVTSTLQARLINPTAWNWRGKAAFLWAGTNLVGIVWTYFRLPEPKGLTFADIDVLFEKRVPARKFSKFAVDPYHSDDIASIEEEENVGDNYAKRK